MIDRFPKTSHESSSIGNHEQGWHTTVAHEMGTEAVHDTIELGDRPNAVIERLKTGPDNRDDKDIPRPEFTIAGRKVVFRNRQEMPTILTSNLQVVGDVPPLRTMHTSEDEYQKIVSYNEQHAQQDTEATMVVTNTPLGIVEAAQQLATDHTLSQWLGEIGGKMAQKQYNEKPVQECTDYILAAISVNENGNDVDRLDSDGFALALAALSGDEEAARSVESRRQSLLDNETLRKQGIHDNAQEQLRNFEDGEVEPLALEKMALVHTTAHEVEMNDTGTIILRPAAQNVEDEMPRSTLHFTVNSRVGIHAQEQDAWKVGEKMVVANLAHVIESNDGRTPEVLEGVDTYYSLNPGEGLELDDATIVEAIKDPQPGELLVVGDKHVGFVVKPSEQYSNTEVEQMQRLAGQLGIVESDISGRDGMLQEIALRIALEQQRISISDMDMPSQDGHGMRSWNLAKKIHAAAAKMGVKSGTHFNHPHSIAEREVYGGMNKEFTDKLSPKMVEESGSVNHIAAGLEMRRQILISGYTPARPLAYARNEKYEVPQGMTF